MVSFKLATAALLATSALAAPHGHNHHHNKRLANKRGAAYTEPSLVHPVSESVSWAYDWNMLPNGILPTGLEYVPMLWGSKMFGGWGTAIQTMLSSGSKYILGFNEPDMSHQANMSPSDAVSSYLNYITPYAGQATLISPAVSNGNGPTQGLNWLKTFMDSCGECNIGGLAVHWYGDSAEDFKNHVSKAIDLGNQYGISEIWVTEFALNSALSGGDPSKSADFLQQVMPWLDSQPNVARYSYFMCATGYLLDSPNTLSISGQSYASS